MNDSGKLSELSLEELWMLFPITLAPHNPEWKEWASTEMTYINSLLSEFNHKIFHIGSTAVPGIVAKPIIDILVLIPFSDDWEKIIEKLEMNGYILMSRSDHRMSFNKGYTPKGYADKVYHIHFHIPGDDDEIIFRDHLLSHHDDALAYERLKLSLLPEFKNDRDGYTLAKSNFIMSIIEKAKNVTFGYPEDRELAEMLNRRLSMKEVLRFAECAKGSSEFKESIWNLTFSDVRRIAVNSLWIITHFRGEEQWLRKLQSQLIWRLLSEKDHTKKRIYLQLLRDMSFEPDSESTLRLLDYCFSKINSECEPYAIRCLSIYIAYEISKDYSELLAELEQYLEMLSSQVLSPGLRSALNKVRRKISRYS